jgi:2-polyprenyl-3-methyl-5-hydroxy-6-metoxy-1,4-benzoquinol methylase
MTRFKSAARALVPPIVYQGVSALRRPAPKRRASDNKIEGRLRPAEWYDAVYTASPKYSAHYSESAYYPVWTVIVDRMVRLGLGDVLDLGCGPGQFAQLLYDKGIESYCGLDFSEQSIAMARQRCATYRFEQADISAPGTIESHRYACVVSLEFLEHIEDDITVIQRIAPNTHVFATVPNYTSAGHVRYFTSELEVADRYETLLDRFECTSILLHPRGSTIYVIEGVTG